MEKLKFKNGKYFRGKYNNPKEYRGWFIGSFIENGHPCKTDKLEAFYTEHKTGDISKPHYHKSKVELMIILKGKARYNINGKSSIVSEGEFLFIDVNNVISGEFLEPSEVFCIHSPSIPEDKINVK